MKKHLQMTNHDILDKKMWLIFKGIGTVLNDVFSKVSRISVLHVTLQETVAKLAGV